MSVAEIVVMYGQLSRAERDALRMELDKQDEAYFQSEAFRAELGRRADNGHYVSQAEVEVLLHAKK